MNQIGQVMKRENWVNDKEAKECQSCEENIIAETVEEYFVMSTFIPKNYFLRCSNYFLPGQYFKLEKPEQRVRLCQGCHTEITQSLQSQGIEIEKKKPKKEEQQEKQKSHSKSFSTLNDILPQSADLVKTPKINQELVQDDEDSLQTQETLTDDHDDVKKVYQQMKDYFDQKIQALIEIVTKKSNLNIQWYQAILQFVKNAIQDIQIDTLSDESMDILNYVKIKRIPFINYNATQYMRGVCLRKNVAHKKMQTYWKLPQILIIKGKLDTDISSLENFLKMEKEWLKKINSVIQKLSPNVIFVEKSVNIALLNDLVVLNITVAQNFSEKQMERISKITSSKAYKATDMLQDNSEIVLGKCDKLIFANYDPESILSNHAVASMLNDQNKHDLHVYMKDKLKRDTTILFIQNQNAKNQVSITLSGPQITELKLVKKTIKEAITLSYEMLMEREFSQIDIKLRSQLLQQFKYHANTNQLMATCGSITDYIASKLQQDLQLLRKSQYNEIRYIRTDYVAIHDLQNTSNHHIERYINERIKGQIYNSKIPWVCKCCEILSGIEIPHYQDGKDRSLIQELLNLKLQQFIPCNNAECKQILGNHFRIIYGPGAYVRIQVKKKGLALKTLQRENSEMSQMENSNIDGQSRNSFEPTTLADTMSQKSSNLIQVEKQLNQETIRKIQVEVHLECANKDCLHRLTKQLRLKKKNFEFSYHKFLRHLMVDVVQNKQPSYLIENQGAKEPRQIKISDQQSYSCYHTTIQRVFTVDDYEIKFYCNQYQVFKNSEIKINFDEYQMFDKKMLDRKKGQYDQIFETYKQKAELLYKEDQKQMRQSSNNLSKLNDKKQRKKIHITPTQLRDEMDRVKQHYNFNQNFNFIDFECECMQVVLKYRVFENQFDLQPKNQMINMLIPKETQQEMYRKQMISSLKQPIKTTSAKTLDKKPRQSLVNDPIGEAFSDSDHESEFQLDKKEEEQTTLQHLDHQPQEDIPMNYFEQKQPEYLFPFIPLFCDFHFIAYALNLPQYHQKVYQKDFSYYREKLLPQKVFESNEQIISILTSEKDIKLTLNVEIKKKTHEKRTSEKQDMNKEQITQGKSPQSPLDGFQESTSNLSPLLVQQSITFNEKQEVKNEKSEQSKSKIRYEAEVILYYPKQFECLRQINQISLYMFIMSIVSCKAWNSQGGKSGSTFFKSEDNLFVFKAIKENEFQSYLDFAPKYFQHMFNKKIGMVHDKKLEKVPSVLNVIYGLFEIKFQKQTTWFIAMENLFQGMTGELQIYDLKGSQAKRWQKKGNTMLDTNYIIDRNFEPLPIQNEDYALMKRALESDAFFLQDCHVVDYSLLLIIEKSSSLIRIGIIDYLQQYSLQKKLENKLKKVMNLGKDPTIVQPKDYRQRFMEAMSEYFMGVPAQL